MRTAHRPEPVATDAPPSIAAALCAGGDDRIALTARGVNAYGFSPVPLPAGQFEFSASTSSTLSAAAFHRLGALRAEISAEISAENGRTPPEQVYADRSEGVRRRLTAALGLSGPWAAQPDMVLAPSGTDLHRLAAGLHRSLAERPVAILMAAPAETGSGVASALNAGNPDAALTAFEIRDADGSPRPAACVEAEIADRVRVESRRGRQVLLIAVDGSKTGLAVPGPPALEALAADYPRDVTVLVDACQLRTPPARIARHLACGFLVAVSGSKFLTGPAFSGALMVPRDLAEALRRRPVDAGWAAPGVRGDWPGDWKTDALPARPNFGLLFRWEAALTELDRFMAVAPERRVAFARRFAETVAGRLAASRRLTLVLSAEAACPTDPADDWFGGAPTIFPFTIAGLGLDAVKRLHAGLMDDADGAGASLKLGQAVTCGQVDGRPRAALRISLSARLVAEACAAAGDEARVLAAVAHAVDRVEQAVAAAAAPVGRRAEVCTQSATKR